MLNVQTRLISLNQCLLQRFPGILEVFHPSMNMGSPEQFSH